MRGRSQTIQSRLSGATRGSVITALAFGVQRLWFIIGIAALLSISSATPALQQQEITELYRAGLAGDKAAVEQCIEKLEAVLKDQPNNQLARVYLGSAYTLRSRDLGFGSEEIGGVETWPGNHG